MKHVEKPWGSFDQYTLNEPCTVKILTVKPGARTSLQSHEHRREFWLALDEGLIVELGKRRMRLNKAASANIQAGVKHRLSCEGSEPARVLEISSGQFSEDDITRYEDDYGRVPRR